MSKLRHWKSYLHQFQMRWGPKGRALIRRIQAQNFSLADLNAYSAFARAHNHMAFYETAIEKFDGQLTFQHLTGAHIAFIGSGAGSGSLDAYRKIESPSLGILFEKIYYNHNFQLAKQAYLTKNKLLQNIRVQSPLWVQSVPGKQLTAVYFQWLDFQSIQRGIENELKAYNLIKTEFENVPVPEVIPDFLLLKKNHGFTNAIRFFKDHFLRPFSQHSAKKAQQVKEVLEELFQTSELELAHGDLHGNNMATELTLVDWDEWGFYPKGYDLASLVSHHTWGSISQLTNVLSTYCKHKPDRSFWMFLAIFEFKKQRVFLPGRTFIEDLIDASIRA